MLPSFPSILQNMFDRIKYPLLVGQSPANTGAQPPLFPFTRRHRLGDTT
jgi:hypothetical protein